MAATGWLVVDERAGGAPTFERARTVHAAVIGGAVPAIAALPFALARIDFVPQVLLGGVIAGSILAGWRARDLAGRSWAWASAGLGVLAPVLAAIVVVAVMATASDGWASDVAETAAGVVFVGLIAIVYALVFATPIAMPVSLAVGWLARRAALMPVRRASVHVALLGVTGAIAGTIAMAATRTGWPRL